jgi:hypothetical protein
MSCLVTLIGRKGVRRQDTDTLAPAPRAPGALKRRTHVRSGTARAVLLAATLSSVTPQAHAQSTAVRRARTAAATRATATRPESTTALPLSRRATAIDPAILAAAVPQQPASRTAISRTGLERILGRSRVPLRVVGTGGVTDLAPSADSVHLRAGDFVFRKMSDTARRVAVRDATSPGPGPGVNPVPDTHTDSAVVPPSATGGVAYGLPYRWLSVDSAGVQRLLIPYFIISGGGLSYDVASRKYRGIALVGVEDSLHPNAGPVGLPKALQLQLTTTRGGRVTPLQLAIGHTGLDYDSVSIESNDSTTVRIRTGADLTGIIVPVPLQSMTVALIPQQKTLQGFGLATTEIAVTLPRGMARADTVDVAFSATSAPVRPASIRVTGAGTSTVRLRSGRPGPDSIRAYLDGVFVGETVVTFERPWAFVGATIAGIVLGGLARFFGAARRKRVKSLYWDVLKGSPFGLIAAAAGAIGLDLFHFKLDDPGTWIAVMLTAALGAWFGKGVIDRAAPTAGAGSKPASV